MQGNGIASFQGPDEMKDNLKDEWFSPIILSCSNTGIEKAGSWSFPEQKKKQSIEEFAREWL